MIPALPRAFWVLFGVTFVYRLGNLLFSLLTLYVTQAKGLSITVAALALSCYGLGILGGGIAGGILADRIGRKPTMAMSLVAYAAVTLLLTRLTGAAPIYLAGFLAGFFTETYRPASSATVADVVPEPDRARAFGLLYWASNLGFTVAVPLATWIAVIWSYDVTLLANAVATLAAALVVVVFLPNSRAAAGEKASSLRGAPGLRRLALITLLTFCGFVLTVQGFANLSLLLVATGYTAGDYGWLMGWSGAVIILFSIPINRAAARLRPALALAAASLLLGGGFLLHGVAPGFAVHALAIAVWCAGEIVLEPIAPALVTQLATADLRGRFLGLWGTSRGFAYLAAPPAGAYLIEQGGGPLLGAGCLALGLAAGAGWLAVDRVLGAADRAGR